MILSWGWWLLLLLLLRHHLLEFLLHLLGGHVFLELRVRLVVEFCPRPRILVPTQLGPQVGVIILLHFVQVHAVRVGALQSSQEIVAVLGGAK